jgi:hypothetical protein
MPMLMRGKRLLVHRESVSEQAFRWKVRADRTLGELVNESNVSNVF